MTWMMVRIKTLENDGSLSQKENLSTTKRMATDFRHGEETSRRDQNMRDNPVHDSNPMSKMFVPVTNGSRMIFLPPITAKDLGHTESQRLWLRHYGTVVLIEMMMERLTGIHCYVGHAAIHEEMTKQWFSVLLEVTRPRYLHASQPRSLWRKPKLILQCWTMCKFHTTWKRVLSSRWFVRSIFCIPLLKPGWIARGKDGKGRKNNILHRLESHERWARRRIPRLVKNHGR